MSKPRTRGWRNVLKVAWLLRDRTERSRILTSGWVPTGRWKQTRNCYLQILLSIASKCLEDFWYWLNLIFVSPQIYVHTAAWVVLQESWNLREHITSWHSENLPVPSWWVSPPLLTSCCAGDSLKFNMVGRCCFKSSGEVLGMFCQLLHPSALL